MGIIFTEYEDSANNNIVFDKSKFDWEEDGDTFPSDAQDDLDQILIETGDVMYIDRESITVDGMGNSTAITNEALQIYVRIDDITKKDRIIHEMGLARAGNRKMFTKHEYSIQSGGVSITYEVKEGDILRDRNNKQWRIVKIVSEPYIENNQIFKVCVVNSIELTGSQ